MNIFADGDGVDSLGPIRVARLTCARSSPDRSARHPEAGALRVYSFLVQASGQSVLSHYGHETVLQEGDLILCDSAAPHSYRMEERSEIVLLRVPAHILAAHLPSPEYFCGRHLTAAQGLTRSVVTLILSLCGRLEPGLAGDFQARVARHLLDMIATCYAIAFESLGNSGSAVIDRRYAAVKLYIEQSLRDPELSPCSIADRLKLSSRYVRMIFAAGSETASAYILRRRLEECARQMADPRWRGHSITEIAFAWGFNSAPHFTRSFRGRYGVSPRHYRRLRLNDSGWVAGSGENPAQAPGSVGRTGGLVAAGSLAAVGGVAAAD